tara:strand:+ start:3705 stop:4631 length:927 start_codon:yes stop_codon:yes gene_type:complete
MSSINIPFEDFPKVDSGRSVVWAPILCHPKDASWERFVVGIVASDKNGFHIEAANRLSRFGCLYEERAIPLLLSIEIALGWLDSVMTEGRLSLTEMLSPVEGLAIGECHTSFGMSPEETARLWMASLSSFYEKTDVVAVRTSSEVLAHAGSLIQSRMERLPIQVLGVVEKENANLLEYFHEDVRKRKTRRDRANARIKIDYNGRKLSANIDRFNVDQPTTTVRTLKHRLWDLAIQRDKLNPQARDAKSFEMLVDFPQHRFLDKPKNSIERIQEQLRELTEQADREKIMLRTLAGAEQIGAHILKREAA